MPLTRKQVAVLDSQFADYVELNEQIKALETKKSELAARLLQLTQDAGGELATARYSAKSVTTMRTTLSEELLLKHGVKPTVIAKSKVETANRPYVRVSLINLDKALAVTP